MPRSRRSFAGPFAACILAGAALGFARPMHSLPPLTWGTRAAPAPHRLYRWTGDVAFRLGETAFGRSGQLRVAVADPLRPVNLPIEWTGVQPSTLRYRWVPVNGTQPRTLMGEGWVSAGLTAPEHPLKRRRPGAHEASGRSSFSAPPNRVRLPPFSRRGAA